MDAFEFAVVGKGLFGSAAARHLSGRSDSVVLIGPDEPNDRRTHDGVFSSHYDQGRLTSRISSNRLWGDMTARTFEAMAELEKLTSTTIHRPVGALRAAAPGVVPRHNRQRSADASGGPVDFVDYAAADNAWRSEFPDFDFPEDTRVSYEGPPAGVLDPRALVAAQVSVAKHQGAMVINELAIAADESRDGVTITLRSGKIVRCRRMLVAAGSFSNHFGLLGNTELPTKVETETYMLATVSDAVGQELSTMATLHYSVDHAEIADLYMTPPLVYPDGQWKVKMGCNTIADTCPSSLAQIQNWFRAGNTDAVATSMRAAMMSILPAVDFTGFETGPCIITMTANDHPIIDRVGTSTFVAVGGNGAGAKSSDGWGALAAELMLDQAWPAWIDAFELGM